MLEKITKLFKEYQAIPLSERKERFGQYVMNRVPEIPSPNLTLWYETNDYKAFAYLMEHMCSSDLNDLGV